MYPAKPGLIIGFHGCDLSVRDEVASGKASLFSNRNSYDWLGEGIYFWENNRQRALEFAKEMKARKGHKSEIKTPSVIGAVLDIGFCLDLLDAEYISLVKNSHNSLLASCQAFGISIPENTDVDRSSDFLLRYLDCAVINNLHLRRESNNIKPFDSVRGVFIEGDPLYPNAGFHDKDHIQICIRKPNCIKGYFLPREVNNKWPVP